MNAVAAAAAPLVLRAEGVVKTYGEGEAQVHALRGVDFDLREGELVVLLGASGSGKSTLLNILGGLDVPTGGRVFYRDVELTHADESALTRYRREHVGFVFQFFNLLPTLTLADNIGLPCLLAGLPEAEVEARTRALASRVGITHRLSHYPQQVSGGEMQRAAIARALVHRPALLVADEPTGNLDSANGATVISLLAELNRELGVTILLATHAADVAAAAHRTIHMRDGQMVDAPAGMPV